MVWPMNLTTVLRGELLSAQSQKHSGSRAKQEQTITLRLKGQVIEESKPKG